MKFKVNLRNKNEEEDTSNERLIDIDIDAERLIEKGMDQHENNWKEKFATKHNAKKELMEIKHKQSIESKEQNLKKKSFVHEIMDGINNKKQLELEEKRKIEEEKRRLEEERLRKEEEEKRRVRIERKLLGIFLLVVGLIMTIVGFGFQNNNSETSMLGSIGFFGCVTGIILFVKK